MHRNVLLCFFILCLASARSQSFISETAVSNSILLASSNSNTVIYTDPADAVLVQKSAALLQEDIERVTGNKPSLTTAIPASARDIIIIGTTQRSGLIRELIAKKKINVAKINNKWEAYLIQTLAKPFNGVDNALVIAGSDRRGAAYGVAELSQQIGVSPWYWWADVPVKKKNHLYIKKDLVLADAPLVKYRGIFINDEAPALSGWSKEKFGGFNHLFYEKVFELMTRLKANYIWPAMWGNAFYADDSLNIRCADDYGIVIGTSHHEPLMRAHDEWRRFGQGKWNYDSNEVRLKEFWRGGMQRASNEKIVSIGMRGDGDEPMSRETATALLERIVKDQRDIIEDVTGKPASETPQLWALYKEVQDYYDKGMRVPDDVTLLLCDDNWGNIRKLPKVGEPARKGGYGIYYHFDYVGGPRNYKWLNTNPIPRVWEQMNLAWEYGARQIWIVNVGDIKPMEFPISFFLDYAWNPTRIGPGDLQKYTERWAAGQFGTKHAKEIARIISLYGKYNSRRKPELLDHRTYNNGEFYSVVSDYNKLRDDAEKINKSLPENYQDAFFQLVLYPVMACANLNELYYNVALNRQLYELKDEMTNEYGNKVKEMYVKDSLISLYYHRINNGKWNHMMSQTHIGYTNWQQPPVQKMPEIKYLPQDSVISAMRDSLMVPSAKHKVPKNSGRNLFFERDYMVSIDASHFTKAINRNGISWKVLPDHGRTGNAITSFPVTAPTQTTKTAPCLEYEFYTDSRGDFKINAYFSPTLNFHNTEEGLQYAIAVDDEAPQIISVNGEDKNTGRGIWNKWVAENIIIKTTNHKINRPGKHTIRYWMINSGVVLQKLVAAFGERPSYLGPPETKAD